MIRKSLVTDLIMVCPKSQCGPGDGKGQQTPYRKPNQGPPSPSTGKTWISPGNMHRSLACDPKGWDGT